MGITDTAYPVLWSILSQSFFFKAVYDLTLNDLHGQNLVQRETSEAVRIGSEARI